MKKIAVLIFVQFLLISFFAGFSGKIWAKKARYDVIKIKAKQLSTNKKYVVYSPDGSIKRADYTTYFFKKQNFKQKLGNPNKLHGNFKVKIQILSSDYSNYIPKDPTAQYPSGGFEITKHYCIIIKTIGKVESGKVKYKVIKINPKYIIVVKKYVIYEPDSDRKKSSYTKYYFKKRNFKRKIGNPNNLKEPVKVKIRILRTENSDYEPDDPRAQSPEGGFNNKRHYSVIIENLDK